MRRAVVFHSAKVFIIKVFLSLYVIPESIFSGVSVAQTVEERASAMLLFLEAYWMYEIKKYEIGVASNGCDKFWLKSIHLLTSWNEGTENMVISQAYLILKKEK